MILVVGLSPAWQRTLWFDAIHSGGVNRARRVVESASGKGVNVARVIGQLGGDARLLTVAGGQRGALLSHGLEEQGIPACVVKVRSETRVCQTMIAAGQVTELVEECGGISRRELASVRKACRQWIRRAGLVVLTGSLPAGCGVGFYASLAREANRAGKVVLLDAQGEVLMKAACESPAVVKVNRSELLAATGMTTWHEAMNRLETVGVRATVMTDGAERVVARESKQVWQFRPPKIRAVNPIGSGDAMLAGMAVRLTQGWTMVEAVRFGVACGTANALTETSGWVKRKDVSKLAGKVRAERVG
jgi:tagatose 6-phosphate kinase